MKIFYTSILSMLLLASCAGDEPSDETSESSSENTETSVEDDALADEVEADLEGLELNAGSKWVVDISTDEGMGEVQDIVDAFDGEDSKQLGKDIKKSLKSIIKGCDMEGEDHEQYHILLEAMLTEAKNLKKGKSTDPSKMKRYLDAYDTHFEVGEIE